MDFVTDATLQRQLKRLKLEPTAPPSLEEWRKLLKYLDAHYRHVDEDRNMMARSLELSTQEMSSIREAIAFERDQLRQTIGTFQTALDEFAEACRSTRNSGGEDTTAITGARKRFNMAIVNLMAQVNENSPENRELLNALRTSFVTVFEEVMSMVNPDTAISDDLVKLHHALIPTTASLVHDRFHVGGFCNQLNNIGGDLWVARVLSDGRLFACLGDATGHGATAGLFSAVMAGALHTWLERDGALDVSALAAHLDQVAAHVGGGTVFMTWCAFVLDVNTQTATIVNAGHTFPVLVRDDEAKALVIQGNPLGAFGESQPKPGRIKINRGDRLVMFSDGVTESRNTLGNEYGERRLRKILESNRHLTPETAAAIIWDDVTDFRGAFNMIDDATVIVTDLR